MSEEMDFFIYLLESYADHKETTADKVMREWDEHGITQTMYDGCWGCHTEAIENACEDIDSLLATGRHAW